MRYLFAIEKIIKKGIFFAPTKLLAMQLKNVPSSISCAPRVAGDARNRVVVFFSQKPCSFWHRHKNSIHYEKQKTMKRSTSLLIGIASMSAAVTSRYFFSSEVAEMLSNHEFRALAEHTVAAFSIPFLVHGTTPKVTSKEDADADATHCTKLWVYGHAMLWEVYQATHRGYYQWHQVLADTLGAVAGLALVEKKAPLSVLEAIVRTDFPDDPSLVSADCDRAYNPFNP